MIFGKNVDLREVEVNDAEFILFLRLNTELSKYLSVVENDLLKQREWIEKSQTIEDEWYYIVQNKNTEPVGTIRIYNIKNNTFCWGSWIITLNARKYASVESIYLLYKFAFEQLGFDHTIFNARINNLPAINFYKKFGAIVVSKNEVDMTFSYTKDTFIKNQSGYLEKIASIKDVIK